MYFYLMIPKCQEYKDAIGENKRNWNTNMTYLYVVNLSIHLQIYIDKNTRTSRVGLNKICERKVVACGRKVLIINPSFHPNLCYNMFNICGIHILNVNSVTLYTISIVLLLVKINLFLKHFLFFFFFSFKYSIQFHGLFFLLIILFVFSKCKLLLLLFILVNLIIIIIFKILSNLKVDYIKKIK